MASLVLSIMPMLMGRIDSAQASDGDPHEHVEVSQYGQSSMHGYGTTQQGSKIALHVAASAGNEDEVRELLRAGSQVDETDDSGMTALMLASAACPPLVEVDTTGVLRVLLEWGAQVDHRSYRQRATALMLAGERGCVQQLQQLLRANASTSLQDREGHVALDYTERPSDQTTTRARKHAALWIRTAEMTRAKS